MKFCTAFFITSILLNLSLAANELLVDSVIVYSDVDSTKIYKYDSNGNLENKIFENWYDSLWVLDFRYTMVYNQNQLLIDSLREYWHNDQWYNNQKVSLAYNNNKKISKYIHELWIDDEWKKVQTTWGYKFNDDYDNIFHYWYCHSLDISWEIVTSTVDNDKRIIVQSFPNPFTTSTTIKYTFNKPNHVTIKIFDALGNEILTLINDFQAPGNYEAVFNAEGLASGMYYYTVQIGDEVQSGKLIYIK